MITLQITCCFKDDELNLQNLSNFINNNKNRISVENTFETSYLSSDRSLNIYCNPNEFFSLQNLKLKASGK